MLTDTYTLADLHDQCNPTAPMEAPTLLLGEQL